MQLDDIYRFFQSPPPTYLNEELTICYVLSVLLKGDSYGTELIQLIESQYPTYRLSDTVLYNALTFLLEKELVSSYWKKLEGRGRPRRMFQILPEARSQAENLAQLWNQYMAERRSSAFTE
ncbi:helix-turn-helix transcriptional regulator [Leptothermofonsia sichuanensis E412]|uniref:PadR family transcriptional regulator n=1 Tax=Leptothermofonsia sichuanensis TaxID=2917832 RepID=UPI001CA5F86C|nr:helix-turn-helix transcriptional regulator [Leptothermofonsia sichuanensis]QZZ23208.1 helix-turn-helix transcriptional regulator [Leptothermofonsia sichuanensis E412]